MFKASRRERVRGRKRGHLGVWDPTGGEAGSGLPVEDCLSSLRMSKIDAFPDGSGAFVAAFAVRVGDEGEPRLRAIEVNLVIGTRYLVTVRDGRAPAGSREHRRAGGGVGRGPRLPLRPARALEGLILLRQNLLFFRRLAVAQQEVLKRLGRSTPAVRDYLSDVEDNQREAVDMADATQDYVEGVIETYRLRRDECSEHAVRRLTILAGVIGPLTLVSGIYGANFARIPGAESPMGFPIFVGAQLLFAVVAVWFLYRRGLF